MAKIKESVILLSPDGKEQVGEIPAEIMEWYMNKTGVKSRSKAAIEKSALALLREALDNMDKAKKVKLVSKKRAKKAKR